MVCPNQHNDRHTKTRGQLGRALFQQRSADVLYADGLLKYDGFSLYGEYAQRASQDPITYKDTTKKESAAVFVGNGYMVQASYIFPSMWNVAARYAVVHAGDQLAGLADYTTMTNIAGVVGYYINKHRIKTNLEIGTTRTTLHNSNDVTQFTYYSRFNMELGI